MENPPKSEAPPATEAPAVPIHVRLARSADIPVLVPLLLRLKRLNEEFDPLLKVREDAEEKAASVLKADLANPKSVVLAAEGVGPDKDKVVGIVRAQVRERPFYTPELEGVILDIYLLPLYRRHGVGEYLLKETTGRLKEKGAGLVTAEFPTQNEIAVKFYAKRGFRPITSLHARSL
ncbi:MAG TPA: GNAT family N-acetyltransferase [Thermoplasmata archaeon]|nr:GNAT family N-acetyltransferase [Thermoplasmata archaeon]